MIPAAEHLAQIAKTGCEGPFYASPETAAALAAEVLTLREQRKALTDYISAEDTGALLNEVVVLREQRDKVLALAADLDALALPMESDPDTEVARATSVGISFAYSHAAQKLRRALGVTEEAETDE